MPTTPEFENAYKGLNAEQREAVDAIDGPMFVIAGPGTGKTQVLTLRIAQILQKTDTTPESILALTYTESAAREMRERLTKAIGSTASRVRFHTFHGFAQSLITRYPDHFARIVGAQVATDADRAEILDAALLAADVKYLRPFGEPLHYHRFARSAITNLKRENVTPAILRARIEASEKEFEEIPDKESERSKTPGALKGKYETLQKNIVRTRDLLAVYELYEKGLTERKRYDYEDLILEAVRALTEDEGFRREVQDSLLYILADEHQDANRAQNALLEMLVEYSERPNIFIVGDEKQAIYRFQGADLDNVQYFKERFKGTKVVVLKENYRSTQTILDNALALISASPDERLSRLPLSAQKAAPQARPITLAILASPEAEASYIADEIEKLVAQGASPDEIAILVRRNRDASWLAEQLVRRGVSVSVGSEEVLHNRFVRALVRLLRFVAEARTENIAGVFALPGFNISAADMLRIQEKVRVEKISVLDILKSDKMLEEAKVAEPETARKLFETLNQLSHEASIERPATIAEEAFKVSGLLPALLQADDRIESLAAIRAFLSMLEQLSEREHDALLPRALELVELHEERNIALSAEVNEVAHQVKLMTVHKAKGREFRYVFMPRLTESSWSTRSQSVYFHVPDILSGANELEDLRRLFYVGLTRAKEQVILSYATFREDGKEESPTPLLEDLDPKLIEKMTSIIEVIDPLLLPEVMTRAAAGGAGAGADQPTADDLQAVRAAFLAQGLSPTALNNYVQCPSKYFYVNLLRLPEAQNKFMLFGTAVHAALKAYADRRTRDDDVNAEYMLGIFSRELGHSPLNTRDINELQEKGKRSLTAWWKENQVSWPSKTEAEVPVEITITLKDGTSFPLRGKLDRIDPLSGNQVRVIDYKTGKQKSRNALMGETKDSDGNYYRQLIAYKLLLARAAEPRDMTEGVIEFVEPDQDTGKLRTESFTITNEEVADLEALIKQSAEEILSLSFWNDACDDPECTWCELRLGGL